MKKVIVASFQRSGTHFLINNMATNFVGIQDGWVDILHGNASNWAKEINRRNLKDKIFEQLNVYYDHSMQKCLKTHYQMYYMERHMDAILAKYDILYIVRDPRDTMVACFHYYNNTNYEAFIKEPVFSRFLRAELWNVRTETQPFSYSHVKPKNIVDKWSKHVLSWLHYKDKGVTFIRYEDLKNRLQEALKHIESKTSQQIKQDIKPVSLDDGRYRPDFKTASLPRGRIGGWKEFFSEDDLRFLSDNISEQTRQFIEL